MRKGSHLLLVGCVLWLVAASASFAADRPANDDWASATVLSGFSAAWTNNNLGATREPGEPMPFGAASSKSIWYRWTAPTSGVVAISLTNPPIYFPPTATNLFSEFDPGGIHSGSGNGNESGVDDISFDTEKNFSHAFAIFTGNSVSNLTLLASGPGVLVRVAKGTSYSIAVDGLNGSSGTAAAFLHLTPPPPNDRFADAISIGGGHVQFTGYDISATMETNEPPGKNSVWWRWTSPSTGVATWTASGSLTNPVLRVLGGTNLAGLVPEATLTRPSASGVKFIARTGRSYWLQMTSPGLGAGALSSDLEMSVMQPFLEKPKAASIPGALDFKLVGTPGTRALIQQSTDLQTWTTFGSVWMSSDEWNTRVFFPTNQPTLFYRSVLLP